MNYKMMNKISWMIKKFGSDIDYIRYSDGRVTMTVYLKEFESRDGKTYFYPYSTIWDNEEVDENGNFIEVMMMDGTSYPGRYDVERNRWIVSYISGNSCIEMACRDLSDVIAGIKEVRETELGE